MEQMEQKGAATEAASRGASLPLNIGEAAKSRYEYMDESDIAFDVLTGLQNAVQSFRCNYDTDKLVKALAFYLVNSDDPKDEKDTVAADFGYLLGAVDTLNRYSEDFTVLVGALDGYLSEAKEYRLQEARLTSV